jgi:hypothetical protein
MLIFDITQQDGSTLAETKTEGIERHLLQRNPKLYQAAGISLSGYTELGRQLGPFGLSPLETEILEGIFRHESHAISAIMAQLQRRTDIAPMPQPTVMERDFSNAFGGLREASSSSPSGLYIMPYTNALHEKIKTNLCIQQC